MLKFEFDPGKDTANRRKHGISLERAVDFDWAEARIGPDTRRDYGEPRFIATGLIEGRLHVMVFARRGDAMRVIGLRKANRREAKRHEEKKETAAH
jgi:uncharacterized protein